MKKRSLILFLLLAVHVVPAKAISPNDPKIIAGTVFASIAIQPATIYLFDKLLFDFGISRKIPMRVAKLGPWLLSASFAAAVSGLSYYISKQYTPHNKYAWALSIKKESELFLGERDHKAFVAKEGSCLAAVSTLHSFYKKIQKARVCVEEAPDDLPEDICFKENCKKLALELDGFIDSAEAFVRCIIYTKKWYQELGFFVLKRYVNSLTWSIEMIGGKVIRTGLFNKDLRIVFPDHFNCLLQNWSIENDREDIDD